MNPSLFPRDAALLRSQSPLTFADETVAAIASTTGIGLPGLFACLYAGSLALLGCAALCLGSAMYRERWTALALLAAVSLRHAIPKTGTNTLEGYFHPRQLAFAFGALAVCAFLKRRYWAVVLLLAAGAALHPTTPLWFAIWFYAAAIVAERRARPLLAGIAALAIVSAVWALTTGPLAGRLGAMDAEWLAALSEKDYLFPLQWPAYAWAVNLAYVAIVVSVWRLRRSSGTAGDRETALVAGSLALVAVFAVALPFQARAVALAIQLQPARVFWLLDLLAVTYVVWMLAEAGSRTPGRTRAAAVAGVFVAIAAGRGAYVMRIEFPDRPLVQVGIRDDDWGRVMAWARSTDTASGWLAHPMHAARYGTSVRVAGERDVFVEALKDAALGQNDRATAIRTRDRIAVLDGFEALTPARAREIAARDDLQFLVTESELDLPVAFRAGALRVYRLRD